MWVYRHLLLFPVVAGLLWAGEGTPVGLPTFFVESESGVVGWSGGAAVEFQPAGFGVRVGSGAGVSFRFLGARAGRPELEKASRFQLTDFRRGREILAPHDELRYRALYPGVDAVFHGRGGTLEYDFEVAAGADASQIALGLAGNAVATVEKDGALAVRVDGRVYRQLAPVAWQERAGERVPVAVRFMVAKNVVRFQLGAYDRRLPLVIDPALDYSTYLGNVYGMSMASDPAGNIYVAMGTDGPLVASKSIGPAGQRSFDVLVAKFDPTGANLVYATLVGGARTEEVTRMAVNAAGEAYVVGHTTSSDFPQVNPVVVNRYSVSQEGFAFRLSADGQNLLYSTILGGAGNTTTYDAAVDGEGNLLIAAATSGGALFPSTTIYAPGGQTGQMGLCLKIGPSGGSYRYASAISGQSQSITTVTGVTVNAAGRVLWLVETNSPAIIPVGGGVAKTSSGRQGMVLEWNVAGTAPVFLSTIFAGTDWVTHRMRFAPDQSLLVLGTTQGNATVPAGERNLGDSSGRGTFLAHLSSDTNRLLLRNMLDFLATEVAVDGGGNLFLGGLADRAAIYDAHQATDDGGSGAFVRKYGPNWQDVVYGTYLGGSREERLLGMTVDPQGRVWLAGSTRSANFPTIGGSRTRPPAAESGETFAFLSRFRDTTDSIEHTFTSQPSGTGIQVDGGWYTTPARFAWRPGTQHTVSIFSGAPGAEYPDAHYFDSAVWEHGGPLGQTITASAAPRTYRYCYTRRECTFSLSPRTFQVGTGGDGLLVRVTTQEPCVWRPEMQVAWIQPISYRNVGSGELFMGVNASPNQTARRGTFSVAGVTVVVDQAGGSAPRPEFLRIEQTSPDPREYRLLASFYDGDGEQDLGVLNILINRSLDAGNACYLAFDSASNTMFLVNDDNTGLTATGLASSTPIGNRQCSIRNVGVERSGVFVRVSLVVRFREFEGDKIAFLAARDRGGANSGWSPRGTVRLAEAAPENTRPQVVEYTQYEAGRIRVQYRDAVAASNITAAQFLINGELNGANACYVGYDGAANVMYLLSDAGTGLLLPGITPGSPGSVSNTQCTLDGATSSRTLSGRDLELNFGLTLKDNFRGHLLYFGGVQSKSPGLANSGWRYLRYLNRTQ
jgi:hypothetical protein